MIIKINNKIAMVISVLILLFISMIAVYAFGTNNPAVFGHSKGEIVGDLACSDGQALTVNSTGWKCVSIGGDSLLDQSVIINCTAMQGSKRADCPSGKKLKFHSMIYKWDYNTDWNDNQYNTQEVVGNYTNQSITCMASGMSGATVKGIGLCV